MQTEHAELADGAKELMEAYEQVKKDEAEKRKALEGVSKECEKLKQAQQKLKCAEVELNAKIETLDKVVKDSSRKAHHWKKEIDQLRRVEKQEEVDYDFSDDEDEDDEEEGDKMQEEAKESDIEEDDAMDESKEEADENAHAEEQNEEEAAETTKKAVGSSSLPKLADASLEQYSIDLIKNDITVLEKERDTLAKNANMGAIAEYRKKEADYLSR